MAVHQNVCDCDDAVTMAEDVRLVPVVFVHSPDETTAYCTVLHEMNIPALAGEVEDPAKVGATGTSRTAILVPAPLRERATEIIASHDASNSIDDDDEDDEDDLFDDDDDDLLDESDDVDCDDDLEDDEDVDD